MSTPGRASKDAVVLTGGGAKGAYEIGILKALADGRSPATGYQPLEVEILTGTSVGAYNAAFLVSQHGAGARQAVASLEAIWRERVANTVKTCGNGIFRVRDAPLNALEPGCLARPLEVLADTVEDAGFWARYLAVRGTEFLTSSRQSLENRLLDTVNVAALFDAKPLYKLIDDTVSRAGLGASDKTLTIAATDWNHGKVRLFSRPELAGPVGLRGIAASTAIPGIFPPVSIDGVDYHDGGVLLNTPLKPAITDGADIIHVIFLDPQIVDIPLSQPPNTVDTIYRMFMITSSALFKNDLARAAGIQNELRLHRDLGIISDDFRRVLTDRGANSRVLRRFREKRPYRPLSIHCYRPKTDLGGGAGLLDFSGNFIDRLIAEGYRDAIGHDCEAEGCVLTLPPEGAGGA